MKKIILFMLLLSSLYADSSKAYFGISYGYIDESFVTLDAQSSSSVFKFKSGYGNRKDYGIEFSIDYTKNKSKIFSSSSTLSSDGNKYGMSIELTKGFDFNIFIVPFIKAGFGAGQMKVERELEKKLSYGTFNLGTGFLIPINEHFDFELGYDYKNISYQRINTIANTISYESNTNTIYFGFNSRF